MAGAVIGKWKIRLHFIKYTVSGTKLRRQQAHRELECVSNAVGFLVISEVGL